RLPSCFEDAQELFWDETRNWEQQSNEEDGICVCVSRHSPKFTRGRTFDFDRFNVRNAISLSVSRWKRVSNPRPSIPEAESLLQEQKR
ncbi:hypothetical protein AVEN_256185-1, partial [Araneus ventricosus]